MIYSIVHKISASHQGYTLPMAITFKSLPYDNPREQTALNKVLFFTHRAKKMTKIIMRNICLIPHDIFAYCRKKKMQRKMMHHHLNVVKN